MAGLFDHVNGVTYPGSIENIVRLNADGSLDSTFLPRLTAGQSISAIYLQPDGHIVVAGTFANTPIARFNPDGTLDPAFVVPNWWRGGTSVPQVGTVAHPPMR